MLFLALALIISNLDSSEKDILENALHEVSSLRQAYQE